MIEDKVKLENGYLVSVKNITEVEDVWTFENCDPFIHMRFDTPITALRIEIVLKNSLNKEIHTAVYYKNKKDSFSEEKCCRYNVYLNLVSMDDIYFSNPVDEIRFDFTDENINVEIESIRFKDLTNSPFENILEKNFNAPKSMEKVLIVSHDLSHSGAPILAYNIAEKLQQNHNHVALLVCNSSKNELLEKYIAADIPVIYLDNESKNLARRHYVSNNLEDESISEDYLNSVISAAYHNGFRKVITNTVISAMYAKAFKKYNFLVVSLIHETKVAIRLLNLEQNKDIANYSDFLVFPDETILQDFKTIYPDMRGKSIVRPQGIYLNKILDLSAMTDFEMKKIGLSSSDRYIIGSGIANLCKGIDLFISAATILHQLDPSLHFVWTGDFADKELKQWLVHQIECAGMKDSIHIIPFISDQKLYQTVLRNAEIFWLSSRADSFPSVVLEAMNFKIPVIGFKDSGGINTIADHNRGILVENFDVNKLAEVTNQFLNRRQYNIDEMSIESFIQQLSFDDYVQFIYDLLNKELIIHLEADLCDEKDCYMKWKDNNDLYKKTEIKKNMPQSKFKKFFKRNKEN